MSLPSNASVNATESLRSRIYVMMEDPTSRMGSGIAARLLLIGTILASVINTILRTVESLSGSYQRLFDAVEWFAVAVFAIEYVTRLWVAPERVGASEAKPWRVRLGYAISPWGLVDLLAVLSSPLNPLFPLRAGWQEVSELFRLLKIARYVPALGLFATVIRNEGRVLLGVLLTVCVLLTLTASIMCVLERDAQPQVFGDIPHAMWWAIVTMGTVGYGDMVPVTPLGRVFGSIVILLGMAMFAVPAGIMGAGFALELRKRSQIITWEAVARVPLFAELDAARIADIARLLKLDVLPPRHAVVRRGEPADAMFFIMSGEVEVDTRPVGHRLGRGQYFGEIALLHDVPRTATVTTLTECRLLALDAADFRRLLEAYPRIRESIEESARRRMRPQADDSPPPAHS